MATACCTAAAVAALSYEVPVLELDSMAEVSGADVVRDVSRWDMGVREAPPPKETGGSLLARGGKFGLRRGPGPLPDAGWNLGESAEWVGTVGMSSTDVLGESAESEAEE